MYLRLYEVGPRDGLQVLNTEIPLDKRKKLISMLIDANLKHIEVGSCVSPKILPMRDSEHLSILTDANCSMLVLNEKGYSRAVKGGYENININISLDDEFNRKNLGKGFDEVLLMYLKMLENHNRDNVRAYISHSFDEKFFDEDFLQLVEYLSTVAKTIVLCDTNGDAENESILRRIGMLPKNKFNLALHLHKGKGKYMEKVNLAYALDVREFDTSITNFGGCVNSDYPTANISTTEMLSWAKEKEIPMEVIDEEKLFLAQDYANLLAETCSSTLLA